MAKVPSENINELDFSEIRKNLLSFVQNNSEFSNYNFEASGLNFILDILAYNTQYSAFYLNQISSEMFIDTAQKRKNVVSLAKQMGYYPESKKSSKATVRFRLTNTQNYAGPFYLKKYTRFNGTNTNGESFPFVTLQDYNFTVGNSFLNNITLHQGVYQQESVIVNNLLLEKKYIIPSIDIDIETLKVFVKDNVNTSKRKRYFQAYDITLLNGNSEIFYLEQNYEGKYQIVFGDGVLGKSIKNNNVIEFEYVTTSGNLGNECSSFDIVNKNVIPTTNYIVQTISNSSAGSSEEDIESIRVNARKIFLSQNRAVTERDYEVMLMRHFNYIDTLSVWGGEKNDPPSYGTIYCAIKPKNNTLLTASQKAEISEKLKTMNVIGVKANVLDPEYSYIKLNCDIVYNQEEITTSESLIILGVKDIIKNYVTTNLLKFYRKFHISDVSRLIDDYDINFEATNVNISLYQKRTTDVGVSTYYNINFNNEIKKGSLVATNFGYLDLNDNFIENCYLVENENFDGISVAKNLIVNGISQKQIVVRNIGSLNYETGELKLETFAPYLPGTFTEMEFEVTPNSYIITPAQNQILTILDNDIIINPIAFTDKAITAANISKSGLFRTV